MADIADMDGKPERGRALGLAEQQWGAKCSSRSGPAHTADTAHSGIMWVRFCETHLVQ